jgi:hypothetical protein
MNTVTSNPINHVSSLERFSILFMFHHQFVVILDHINIQTICQQYNIFD